MALEKMKNVTIFFPAAFAGEMEEWLYGKSIIHLVDVSYEMDKLKAGISPLSLDDQRASENVAMTEKIARESASIGREKKSFIDSMLPVKTIASPEELGLAIESIDLQELSREVVKAAEAIKEAKVNIARLRGEREAVQQLSFLRNDLKVIRGLKRTFMMVASSTPLGLKRLSADPSARGILAWEMAGRSKEAVILLLGGDKRKVEKCRGILQSCGIRILDLPSGEGSVAQRLNRLQSEAESQEKKLMAAEVRLKSLLGGDRLRKVDILKGYWESEKKRAQSARAILQTRKVGVVRGYVTERDHHRFLKSLSTSFPGAEAVVRDPLPPEKVPVAVKLSRFFRPGQLLINMMGMPSYFSFDPTPFLMFVFLLFFGICFGDVFYGSLLMFFSSLLVRRYRRQDNLKQFFRLFFYCGISTVIMGALTGSWAADIYSPQYLGEGNLLLRVAEKLKVFDPLQKPVMALLAALLIGVFTQFYGIGMRILRDFKENNPRGAFYDGILWLLYLISLILTAFSLVSGAGGPVFRRISLGVLLFSAAGLVLTQGRDQKSLPARLITGLVSLYGVMGAYGTTSFVGDVISYSRLLALALTTFIVGMSFNIITGLISSALPLAPLAQKLIFLLLALGGHLFNFLMSILSAFVHSARLILLEFFNRFYSAEGLWFKPHGFQSETLQIS